MKNIMTRLILVCSSFIIIYMYIGQSYAEIDPRDAIVGRWLFNEGEGDEVRDSSGNGHDGKIRRNVKWVKGKFNGALEFPGGASGSMISIPDEDSLDLVTFTITAWINVEDTGKGQAVMMKLIIPNLLNYALTIDSEGVSTRLAKGRDIREAKAKKIVTDKQWHHVAGTYNKEFIRTYVDGVLEAEKECSDTPDTNFGMLTIGAMYDSTWALKGIVDEVALFNAALTEGDINKIMTEGLINAFVVESANKLSTTWGAIKARY